MFAILVMIFSLSQSVYAGNDVTGEGGYQELPQFGGSDSAQEFSGYVEVGYNPFGPQDGIKQPLPDHIDPLPAPGYGQPGPDYIEAKPGDGQQQPVDPIYGQPGPDYGSDEAPSHHDFERPPKKPKKKKSANQDNEVQIISTATGTSE